MTVDMYSVFLQLTGYKVLFVDCGVELDAPFTGWVNNDPENSDLSIKMLTKRYFVLISGISGC